MNRKGRFVPREGTERIDSSFSQKSQNEKLRELLLIEKNDGGVKKWKEERISREEKQEKKREREKRIK